ncbi:MAG: hypothetical protein IT445_12085 [Phycisphaeraceae bacterium]|nr:hypothetical protein [Phycisphaeraceae bacterium]
MATRTWIGGATAGAQIVTITVGGSFSGETFEISVSGVVIASYTQSGGDGANEIAQGLVTSWNNSTNPLATDILATDTTGTTTGTLTLMAETAGVPFTVTLNTPGGSATFSQSTTAANYGPNDWNTVANWEERAIPVASDDVIIQGSISILYGLDQSSIELDSFRVTNYSGNIGGPGNPLKLDIENSTGIFEYESTGIGYIDLGDSAISPLITGTSASSTGYGLYLTGGATGTLASVTVKKGRVALFTDTGVTKTITTIVQSYDSNPTSDTVVEIGDGVTLTTLQKTGGTCVLRTGATTVQNDAGQLRTEGSGAIATLNVLGGTVIPNSTGTITNLNAKSGIVDFTRSLAARTVTNATIDKGATIKADASVVTITNKVGFSGMLMLTAASV